MGTSVRPAGVPLSENTTGRQPGKHTATAMHLRRAEPHKQLLLDNTPETTSLSGVRYDKNRNYSGAEPPRAYRRNTATTFGVDGCFGVQL